MHVMPNSDCSKYSLTLITFWTQCIQKIEHFYELLQQLSIKSYRAFLLHAQNMFERGELIINILGDKYVLCLSDYNSNY